MILLFSLLTVIPQHKHHQVPDTQYETDCESTPSVTAGSNPEATSCNQRTEVLCDAEHRLSCQLQATQLLIKSQNCDTSSKDNTYLENWARWLADRSSDVTGVDDQSRAGSSALDASWPLTPIRSFQPLVNRSLRLHLTFSIKDKPLVESQVSVMSF